MLTTKRALFVLFALLYLPSFAQTGKLDSGTVVKVKTNKSSYAIAWDLRSATFYFKKADLIAYLEMEDKSRFIHDVNPILLSKLKSLPKSVSYPKHVFRFSLEAAKRDTLQEVYSEALGNVAGFLLNKGKAMVFNKSSKTFVTAIMVSDNLYDDFLGLRDNFKIYFMDGTRFYDSVIRTGDDYIDGLR